MMTRHIIGFGIVLFIGAWALWQNVSTEWTEEDRKRPTEGQMFDPNDE